MGTQDCFFGLVYFAMVVQLKMCIYFTYSHLCKTTELLDPERDWEQVIKDVKMSKN